MNRNELFKEIYDSFCNNLLCYSNTALMNTPKKGYEEEWKKENEKIQLIQELIEEEKQKERMAKNTSFTMEEILKMYPSIKYYIKNSKGELLAGTVKLEDAKKCADKYKKQYVKDEKINNLGVQVFNRQGKNVYNSTYDKRNINSEEIEELEEFEGEG